MNLSTLLMIVRQLEAQIVTYDEMITELSTTESYKKPIKALCCFRGIGVRTAMILTNEIGDISRFNHPKKLTSYSGMDIIEKSSVGSEKKFNITHMGNKHIRTAVVEACQTALKPPKE